MEEISLRRIKALWAGTKPLTESLELKKCAGRQVVFRGENPTGFYGLTQPGSLVIPMVDLFCHCMDL